MEERGPGLATNSKTLHQASGPFGLRPDKATQADSRHKTHRRGWPKLRAPATLDLPPHGAPWRARCLPRACWHAHQPECSAMPSLALLSPPQA